MTRKEVIRVLKININLATRVYEGSKANGDSHVDKTLGLLRGYEFALQLLTNK